MQLRDSVALITGTSRGLGLEVAKVFARRGARLVLTARDEEALARAVRTIRAEARDAVGPEDVLALAGDLGDPDHIAALVRAGLERFGQVDILVNNASALGPSPMPRLADLGPEALWEVLRVNVLAPHALIQGLLPSMQARRCGLILNVTSDAAVEAYPGWGGYGASKAALEHLSRVLAAELDGLGIRVYVVDPGDMNTRMHEQAEPGVDLSHLPSPAAVAPAFVSLVEREAAPFGRFQAQRMADPAGSVLR
ncbi:MAG TPA: SDR family oxidoreductase [bacterium]|nr:SDR family oxidoreductase [bacterium]